MADFSSGSASFLEKGGKTGERMRAMDWSTHRLGDPASWPPGLQVATRMALAAPAPMAVIWGHETVLIPNDAMGALLFPLAPAPALDAIGVAGFEHLPLAWRFLEPDIRATLESGQAATLDPLLITADATCWCMSLLPIDRGDGSSISDGLLATLSPARQPALAPMLSTDYAHAVFATPQAVNAIARTWAVSPDLLGVLSSDACFEAVNPAWSTALGWSREELCSMRMFDLVHPDDLDQAEIAWDNAHLGVPALRFETRYRCKTDDWRWLSWVAIPEGAKVYCSARDIDEQKQQALALSNTVAERDRLWRSSQDLYLALSSSRVLAAVNPTVEKTLGWLPEEMVGRDALDFVLSEDVEVATHAFARAVHGAIPLIEFRCRHKDGGNRWISWAAAPEGDMLFATGRHVSDQKKAEEALALTLADRDRIWRNSHDIIAVIDLAASILSINPRADDVLGWSADEMLRRSILDFIHPDDHPTMVGGQLVPEIYTRPILFENRFKHKDGSYRNISWSCGIEDGLIYAHGRDVTLEREQSEALRAAEQSLRQSQKMDAVGQLTGGLAHDFNNLLAGICGNLELISMRMKHGRHEEIPRHVASAQGAAKRAAALTHRLLAFSRRQTLDPTAVSIAKLLSGMAELIDRAVGPEIVVSFQSSPDLWPTLVDANQLENVCLNLCINSRDAMPRGGSITISAANVSMVGKQARDLDLPVGDYVHLAVADNGDGMEAEVVAKAFDPFFTTKPLGLGTGLGLSMAYGFVRQSGGQIHIQSQPGAGTSIHIHLPRHFGPPSSDATSAEPALEQAPRGETILVVDDEPTIRFVMAETLRDAGYEILEAADGNAGLALLRSDARIDLLLTDVGLPGGMNGRQMADAARVARPHLKVIFITGYAESIVMRGGGLDAGMAILTKPFVNDSLMSKIHWMLDER